MAEASMYSRWQQGMVASGRALRRRALRRRARFVRHVLTATGAGMVLLAVLTSSVTGGNAQGTGGRAWYVAPNGSPTGTGAPDGPLDLATALSQNSPVAPGDTVWLRGGTYRGRFDSYLRGTPTAPIIVSQVPGERATIDSNDGTRRPPDGALNLRGGGGYAWYWGFEITNSDPRRASGDEGAFPTDMYRANGVNVYTSHVKLINLVIHDVENGIFVGDRETDVEIDGVLSYYNGHDAPSAAWGHGIYVQNASRTSPRLVRNTISAFNFSHGLHAYGGADRGLNAIHMIGNTAFQNGATSRFHLVRNLLLGGLSAAEDALVSDNYTYFGRSEGENNIGWSTGAPGAIVIGNRFVGGRTALTLRGQPSLMRGNMFYGATSPSTLGQVYPSNQFQGARRPDTLETFVRASTYERGRAHVTVYNWPLRAEVAVDLTDARMRRGARYEVRDALDLFGPPVVSGEYTGSPVTIPLQSRTLPAPVGQAAGPAHTLPEFGVFVVTPVYARPRP